MKVSGWRIVAEATEVCYDYLGLTLSGSFIISLLAWSLGLIVSPRLFGPSPAMQIIRLGLLFVPLYGLMAGPAELSRRMLLRDDPSLRDLWRGWRAFGARSLGIGCINAAVGVLLFGDLYFLLSSRSRAFHWLALPFVSYLFLFTVVQFYALPAGVIEGQTPFAAFLHCHYYLLLGPGISAVLLLTTGFLAGASMLTWLPLAAMGPVWLPCVGLRATFAFGVSTDSPETAART